jgi:anthranilate phosphoribosyltransferase
VAQSIETFGFGFCFAPRFHPAMKAVAEVRRTLGIRTIFNVVGPLANPAPLTFQLVGVSEERLMRPMADALQASGIRHGMVVHGADGLDEVTTTAETTLLELRKGTIREQRLRPEDVGIARVTLEALRGGDAQENARIAREALSGGSSAPREIVAFNAGCAIYVADRAQTIHEGVGKATAALASGRAQELLERVVKFSHGE